MNAPLSHSYNLGRLGNAGDAVRVEADDVQRAAIAAMAGALSLSRFAATVVLTKTAADKFLLACRLEADVTQACVVTLEPVAAHVERAFSRALHFTGTGRRPAETAERDPQELSLDEGEETEEIESLHYDLAGPLLEEFLLALDPYPRCPGVEFDPGQAGQVLPESPFAALKSLKSSK
jgi:uncharacterized metal-binding protein YceD (DUF177 family)